MIQQIDLNNIEEYASIYTDIYTGDLVSLQYNKVTTKLYNMCIDNKLFYTSNYNLDKVTITSELKDSVIKDNSYLCLNQEELLYYNSDDYSNTLVTNFTVKVPDVYIGSKFKLLSKPTLHFNDKFQFTFDGDTGDTSAGDDVTIKDFLDKDRDRDIIDREVKWVNKDGDDEIHKITYINSDKTTVRFDGDIKDTADGEIANTDDTSYFEVETVIEHRFKIQG